MQIEFQWDERKNALNQKNMAFPLMKPKHVLKMSMQGFSLMLNILKTRIIPF